MNNQQDTAKLHAEINLYVNQCFTIAMTAITVFGVIGGWILGGFISNISGGTQPQVKPATFLLSILLIVLLSVLFYVLQTTYNNMAVLAAYLRQKNLSSWETDLEQFRSYSNSKRLKHIEQGQSRAFLFLVLGIATFLMPLILMVFGFLDNTMNGVCLALHIIISATYCIFVFMMYKEKLFKFPKEDVVEIWKKIITPVI